MTDKTTPETTAPVKPDAETTNPATSEENAPALPPKLAATLARIEAEGCESSRQARQIATWDCDPDEADAVVAAWEAKREKLARVTVHKLSRAPADAAQSTMKTTSTDTDPEFVFLGIPRRHWGPMTLAAFNAENHAKSVAAEAETADKRLAELRAKLEADSKRLADAEEDATLARNAAARARENFDRAASREEREEWKAKLPEMDAKADELAVRAKEIKREIDGGRNAIQYWTGEVQRQKGNALRVRQTADAAAKNASAKEIPEIRARLAKVEAEAVAAKEADALRAARERLPRTVCRDCRFWEPFGNDPTRGPCHALPPSTGTGSNLSGVTLSEPHIVLATNWCGKGEPLPTADKPRKAAPVLA